MRRKQSHKVSGERRDIKKLVVSSFGGVFGDSDWNRNWENDIRSFKNEKDIQKLPENATKLSYGSLCGDSNYTDKLDCKKLGFAGVGSELDSLIYNLIGCL